jgi:hypothetical protein
MTQVKSSFGTLLQLGDAGAPEAFTTVAEVLDIGGPALSHDTEEVTNHSSPNGWEEFITTIGRSGEVTFPINFIPTHATHDETTGLVALAYTGELRNWRLVLSTTGKRWQFSAMVTNFEGESPVIGKQGASVTLKISQRPNLVVAA